MSGAQTSRSASQSRPGHGLWPLRGVLFDMDGLLVDSEPLWFEAERAVMARLGGQWTPADQEELLGGSLERTVGYLLGKAAAAGRAEGGAAGPGQVGRWLLDGMTELMLARGLPLRPGARALLAGVAASGVPYALVTSSQREIMDTVLSVTGMTFPVTVCREDVDRGKPDPEPYLRAASLLGVPPAGCVALEDSPNGLAAAAAAGCAVIAVPSLPMPAHPGWLTVSSLREIGLRRLREVAAGHQARGAVGHGGPGVSSGGAERPPAATPRADRASPDVCDDEGERPRS